VTTHLYADFRFYEELNDFLTPEKRKVTFEYLLKRRIVIHGYFVRIHDPRKQLDEVLTRFDLYADIKPFSRCMRCNGMIGSVDKNNILDRLEPKTLQYYDKFWQCGSCGQIYWKGSHFKKILFYWFAGLHQRCVRE